MGEQTANEEVGQENVVALPEDMFQNMDIRMEGGDLRQEAELVLGWLGGCKDIENLTEEKERVIVVGKNRSLR